MIKVFYKNGRYFPVFLCDTCGERIENADSAVAVYPHPAGQGEYLDVLYVHRGECHTLAEQGLERTDICPAWVDMSYHACILLLNTGLDCAKLGEILELHGTSGPVEGSYYWGVHPTQKDQE